MISYSDRGGGVSLLFTLPSPSALGRPVKGCGVMPLRITSAIKSGAMWTRGQECWFVIGTSVTRCKGWFDCLPGGKRIKDVEWTGDLKALPLMQGFEVRCGRGGEKKGMQRCYESPNKF